ncbi:hypothetical protein [Pseudarthrobacter sp. MM222]|nr:hypothetical protein [Pseudarthrobacter sp. MM222]CAI3794326.1 hypothetical protein NKCBBBOE_01032 [Pseudarthrobacter sp. MM222]
MTVEGKDPDNLSVIRFVVDASLEEYFAAGTDLDEFVAVKVLPRAGDS